MITDVVIDSNLLLLLVVGMTNPAYVTRHKRLKAFTKEDFALVVDELQHAQRIVLTPNTVTEASNLLDHIDEPARREIYKTLKAVIDNDETRERYVSSRNAVGKPEYFRLGVTDCTLIDVCSVAADSTVLLTVDVRLALAAEDRHLHVVNFHHLRRSFDN